MKTEKAIEILTDLLSEGPQFPPNDRRDAVKLGIEALKALQRSIQRFDITRVISDAYIEGKSLELFVHVIPDKVEHNIVVSQTGPGKGFEMFLNIIELDKPASDS